jgi:hypothetical protein
LLQKVAEEEGYSKEQKEKVVDPCLTKLEDAGVFTVRNLRGLTKEQITAYDLPDVVKNYLLRVKG